MKGWYRPLAIALSVQLVSSLADMTLPVLAPLITADAGVPAAYVGYYASAVSGGAVLFYLLGGAFVRLAGPVRTLLAGGAVCALGLLLELTGSWWAIVGAGLLIGIGFGTNAPASGVLLHAAVPRERRYFAFSLKQAGVPVGSVLAGLCLPILAALWSWRLAVLTSFAVGVVVLVAVHRLGRSQPAHAAAFEGRWLDLRRLVELARTGVIRRLMIAGALLAIAQGSVGAFFVTYLVEALGHSLVLAGSLFAWLQLVGIGGRIASGWLADRAPRFALAVLGAASALSVAALALMTPHTPVAMLGVNVVALGLVIGSWNGVLLAQVTAEAPADRIAEANSVAAIGVFGGGIVGPLLFAQIVAASGRYATALLVVAASAALSLAALPWRSPHGPAHADSQDRPSR